MNAEQIRGMSASRVEKDIFLREIAAQLAELNENLKILFTPTYVVDTDNNQQTVTRVTSPKPAQSPANKIAREEGTLEIDSEGSGGGW